jgi:hypothetical protein
MLSTNGRSANHSAWALVSTHVPGRSGRECRDRWGLIADDVTYWLQPGLLSPATGAVSHMEAAAAAVKAHLAAAAAAAAAADSDADMSNADAAGGVRCCISGCTTQLLQCNGHRQAGEAVGCAESSHVLCAPCLERWFASQSALREESGLLRLRRRACPVCQTELRAAGAELRADIDRYAMGLLKVV